MADAPSSSGFMQISAPPFEHGAFLGRNQAAFASISSLESLSYSLRPHFAFGNLANPARASSSGRLFEISQSQMIKRPMQEALDRSYMRIKPLDWTNCSLVLNPAREQWYLRSASYIGGIEELDDGSILVAGLQISRRRLEIAVAAMITVFLAVSNKVLYRMALVPLKNYPFFLAQLNTVGYLVVYSSILFYRWQTGIVTNEMLAVPKPWFVALGALEAIGLATGMAAAAVLPGALIPVLAQAYLVWQLLLSSILLKKHYTRVQVFGCLLVIAGLITVVSSSGTGVGPSLDRIEFLGAIAMIVSCAFSAGGSIIKEFLFQDAATHIQGGSIDLFVVNTFGSAFQALFVFLLLPILSSIRGIPVNQLSTYFKDGATCFLNIGHAQYRECSGAPLIPLLYIVVNMMFNISALNLLKMSSAVVASLGMTLAVPFSIWIFTVPLPYLGTPTPLTAQLFYGVSILVLGLLFYSLSGQEPAVKTKQA